MRTSLAAMTLMPAASSAFPAGAPALKQKCATPRASSAAWTTHAPPPSMLTPARPRASPISANAPGRSSRAIARSFIRSGALRWDRASMQLDDYFSVADVNHALRFLGDVVLVGNHDDRVAARGELAKKVEDFAPGLRVEVAGRLVGEQ